MATVPGGLFDSSSNPNISTRTADIVSQVLNSLGISESNVRQVTVSNDPGDVVVQDPASSTLLGQVVMEPGKTVSLTTDDGPPVFITGSGETSLGITFGGGSDLIVGAGGNDSFLGGVGNDTQLGGAGNDSVVGGAGDDINLGGDGNDVVTGIDIQALTIEGDILQGGADSLTGGGAAISDAQRAYYLTIAQKFGAGTSQLVEINKAIALLSENGDQPASNLLTYYVRLGDGSENSTLTELRLDGGDGPQDVMLLMRLADVPGITMAFANMEKLLLVGQGAARIDDADGAMVVADNNRQVIAGGTGNDTLVGGGGQDTLIGGAGADVFGFIKRGHVTINDFAVGTDKLAFDFAEIGSKADLLKHLTSIENVDGNTRFYFGSDASITLVGVTATGLFDDMLFNIS